MIAFAADPGHPRIALERDGSRVGFRIERKIRMAPGRAGARLRA